MKKYAQPHIAAAIVLSLVLLASCASPKNTAKSRFWHAFNARYNAYYNGAVAYVDASLEKENGNRDNYTELLPLYTVGNKASREIGKSNYERAVEKCQKVIQRHSIKRRPEWNKSRKKTARDIEWLSRREYNPFLWKAWLLMGRSQFHMGQFEEAAATFAYMARLYATQPAILGKARAWLAKSYVEAGWQYDAEDVIKAQRRDSMHWAARKEWDYTMADYYLHTAQLDSAALRLRRVIKHEMRRKQKARELYLLGQIEAARGNGDLALKAFRRVARLNPPYELDFNARIAQTEVMASSKSTPQMRKKMVARLKRMAANDNNKDYLDQVYYAMGNIHLASADTLQAIAAYENGAAKATRSGIEKGVLLLHLGDIYWQMERFSDAQRCYGEAIGLLDKDRKDYRQLSDRSKMLDELVPHTEAVHLQDSLQALVKMPEKERLAAIDRVIDALKKKEREERRAQAEQEAAQNGAGGTGQNATNRPATATQQSAQRGQQATWYFYNPTAVAQGKSQFQRLWGKRDNADNWQRKNTTVVASQAFDGLGAEEMTDAMRDSLARAAAIEDSLALIADSAQNDPHRREYYLAQLPFTPDQLEASNATLADGLYGAGVVLKDKMDQLPLAERHLLRLVNGYPAASHRADAFYHLFLLYNRQGRPQEAEQWVDSLRHSHPDHEWTRLLTDPHFADNARYGVHMEDSLYAATYEAFKADRLGEVKANARLSADRFPEGLNRDKFLFIGGLGKLNGGDADGCLADMQTVVEKHPGSRVAELAGMIVNGVKDGRRLRGGRFDLADVWTQRAAVLTGQDSASVKRFSDERNTPFSFMLVYRPDSVDENKLLFELARFNFTTYLVRSFDIEIDDDPAVGGALHRMRVSGFQSYDEAMQYARAFAQQSQVVKHLGDGRPVIISDDNLDLLSRQYSYDDYAAFYAEHFAPLTIERRLLLTEPAERPEAPREPEPVPADDHDPAEAATDAPADDALVIPADDEPDPTEATTTIDIATDEPQAEPISEPTEAPEAPAEQPTPAAEQPDAPAGGLIIDDEPATQSPASEPADRLTIDDEPAPAAPKPAETPAAEPPQPAPQPEMPATEPKKTALDVPLLTPTQPDKPATDDTDDDDIYFDDGFGGTPATPTSGANEPQPKQQYDLDDEYFDLDGF